VVRSLDVNISNCDIWINSGFGGRNLVYSSQNDSAQLQYFGGYLVLEACIFATVLCGFFGIILKKNFMMKIIAMDVMSTGVIAYYVLVAARNGLFTPIVGSAESGSYADPVPQAVILTAIVIGFSIQALMLVGVMKLARDNPLLDSREIEINNTP
jgi:multicomponent Na+:H+ antiporter subunit C